MENAKIILRQQILYYQKILDEISKEMFTMDKQFKHKYEQANKAHEEALTKSSKICDEYRNLTGNMIQIIPKFCGWKIKLFQSDNKYMIPSFNAVFGSHSGMSVIKLMAFKDFIFASFTDHSVRRYTFSNYKNLTIKTGLTSCLEFNGHLANVLDMKIICCDIKIEKYHFYTVCYDKMLRRFNPFNGYLLKIFDLGISIICIDFCWLNLYIGQSNGYITKIKSINDICDDINIDKPLNIGDYSSEKFFVSNNKSVSRIRAIRCLDPNIEPIIAITNKNITIINTKSLIDDSKRLLLSLNVDFCVNRPIHMNVYKNYMFMTFTEVRNDGKNNNKEESHFRIYDLRELQKRNLKPYRHNPLDSYATSLEFYKDEVVLTCFDGEIRCFDINKFQHKWHAYHTGVISASVYFGNCIVIGDEYCKITPIYVDSVVTECKECYVQFVRNVDIKQHITRHCPKKSPN